MLSALAVATSLAWTGRLAPPGAFKAIPDYWHQAAAWLTQHNTGEPTPGRVLVVPGAPFATQVWGNTHDEPLQVLGEIPWGVRDSIPLTPPQTIRALDSVQRLLAAGQPSAGLADTLARQGMSYVVVRNDLDPDTSRQRVHFWYTARSMGPRAFRRWHSSAIRSGPAPSTASSATADCGRGIPR